MDELKKISGAIHLPAINTIIFQTDGTDNNYIISYGNNSFIKKMPWFSLDLDDGFYDKYAPDDANAISNIVIDQLQILFSKWKHSNYAGPIITEADAHFVCDTANANSADQPTPKQNKLQSTNGLFPKNKSSSQSPFSMFNASHSRPMNNPGVEMPQAEDIGFVGKFII